MITNILNERKLTCENEGCSETIEYSDWYHHELACQMFIEECSGCGMEMPRSGFIEHKLRFKYVVGHKRNSILLITTSDLVG